MMMAKSQQNADEYVLAATVPRLVKIAGAMLMLMGLIASLQSFQVWAFGLPGLIAIVPYVMLLSGVASVGVGFFVTRMRGWATKSGVALSAAILLATSAWSIHTTIVGFVAPVEVVVPPLALATCVLAVIANGRRRRAELARQRLAVGG